MNLNSNWRNQIGVVFIEQTVYSEYVLSIARNNLGNISVQSLSISIDIDMSYNNVNCDLFNTYNLCRNVNDNSYVKVVKSG